jgi:hypothetical protein
MEAHRKHSVSRRVIFSFVTLQKQKQQKTMEKFEKLKALVESMDDDHAKFEKGNDSAGARLRKGLMDVKNLAHELRGEIQEKRNAE